MVDSTATIDEGQFRRACDRCHTQKLRCRRDGGPSCVRCTKAKATCVFSPSLRLRKAQQPSAVDNNEQASSSSQSNTPRMGSNSTVNGGERVSNRQGSVTPPTKQNSPVLNPISESADNIEMDDAMHFGPDKIDWTGQDADTFEYDLQRGLDGAISTGLPTALEGAMNGHCSANDGAGNPNRPFIDSLAASYRDLSSSQMNHPQPMAAPGWMTPDSENTPLSALPWISRATHGGGGSGGAGVGADGGGGQGHASPRLTPSSHAIGGSFNNDGASRSHNSTAPGTPRPSEREIWICRLSQINIKLYRHAAAMSSQGDSAQSGRPAAQSTFMEVETDVEKDFAIDQTFDITLQLLDILNSLQPSYQESGLPRDFGADSLDHGTLLLIFSSFLRLLDIYSSIFQQLQTRLGSLSPPPSSSGSVYKHPGSSPHTSNPSSKTCRLRFPQLSIGDFSLQAPSTIHSLVIVQLAEQLLERVHRSMQYLNRRRAQQHSKDRYDAFDGHAEDGGLGDVAEVSLSAVQKRQMEVVGLLREVKRVLIER